MDKRSDTVDTTWLGLNNRVCVVTGAGGGVGSDIARALAAAGASVALLDRDEAAAAAVAAAIASTGGRTISIGCDVALPSSVATAAQKVANELGPCEVLVNNAATISAGAIMEIDLDRWNQLLAVNLNGYLLCAQAFGRQMSEHGGGSLIHVASISGSHPQPYSGAYSVSKAGVSMLSRLLAVELSGQSVRSNLVSPAMIRTPLSEGFYSNTDILQKREGIVPAGRISTPQDIADTVLFLASERSSYINGQDILVDGGLSQAWLSMIPRPGFDKESA